jgi:hypothetical protein
MLRCVALVRTDVSEELSASFIRVKRVGELGTTLAVISNRRTLRRNTGSIVPSSPTLVTLMKEALSTSETLVLTRATRRNIPEDAILHSHRRENLKSYMRYIAANTHQYADLTFNYNYFNIIRKFFKTLFCYPPVTLLPGMHTSAYEIRQIKVFNVY